MTRLNALLILSLPVLLLASCSDWEDAMTASSDPYTVQLMTDPSPPPVGRNAEVSTRILDGQGRAVRACHVSFRQHMPGMEMHTDDIVVPLEEMRSGVYSGISPEYSMGGDWRIEVNFDCGEGVHHATFDFTLEWPE